jgi:hypothetical protein
MHARIHCGGVPLLLAVGLATAAPAATRVVDATGANGAYRSVKALLSQVLLKPGDTVEIHAGTYAEAVGLSKIAGTKTAPITFRGMGKRPIWDGRGKHAGTVGGQGRALWEVGGDCHDLVFENIEWFNARSNETENAAGIRLLPGAERLAFRRCRIHHCQNGFFTSHGAADLLIEFCEVDHNGNRSTDQEHGFYVSADGLTVQHCYIHDNGAGANYKSRSKDEVFRYNWVENAGNFEIDLVEDSTFASQDAWLYGNVIIQADGKHNWNKQDEYPTNTSKIVKFGGEGHARKGTLYFVNNTVVGHFPNTALFQADSPVIAVNNVYLSDAKWQGRLVSHALSGGPVSGSNNWFPAAAKLDGLSRLRGTLTGTDPGFVAAGSLDFHLKASSPLRNVASRSLPATVKLTREPARGPDGGPARTGDGPVDIGAFEFR